MGTGKLLGKPDEMQEGNLMIDQHPIQGSTDSSSHFMLRKLRWVLDGLGLLAQV